VHRFSSPRRIRSGNVLVEELTMNRRITLWPRMTFAIAAVLALATPHLTHAQQARRRGPSGDANVAAQPANAPAASAGLARFPFSGEWTGSMTIIDGPGSGSPIPIGLALAVEDTVRGAYSGATLMPGGARVPHLGVAVTGREMKWRQTNNGGGRWHYSARLVSRDSIAGTVKLVGWPDAGATPPNGTFSLVRRAPGQRGAR
jgi:hypothetical protein